jgi:hypothetical protein
VSAVLLNARLRRGWVRRHLVWVVAFVAVVAAGVVLSVVPADAASLRAAGVVYRSQSDGLLWELGPDGVPVLVANGLGMAAGTVPAEAALPSGGGRVIAFNAAGTLWYVDANNVPHNTSQPMAAGSSPAITALANGSWAIVFAGSDNLLYEMGPAGQAALAGNSLGVAPGTSPAVAGTFPTASADTFVIAFHAPGTDTLWYVDASNVGHDSGQKMAAGTSPAIAASGGIFEIAYENELNHLAIAINGHPLPIQNIATDSGPAVAGLFNGLMDPPGAPLLQAFPDRVIVNWVDKSIAETEFDVQKRNGAGEWTTIYSVATHNSPGRGEPYAMADTDHSVSGQCYRVVATNGLSSGNSTEQCTVRPSGLPTVPGRAIQWSGLSSVNGGSGALANLGNPLVGHAQYLYRSKRTFGVDLDFRDSPSSWMVQAQGGPQLMKGQAVALWVPGGGWLTLGDPTFGIGLGFDSEHPSYEWSILGAGAPGEPLSNGTFALWNSRKQDFLDFGNSSVTVNLFWDSQLPTAPPTSAPGVRVYQLYNCSLDQQSVSVYVQDVTNNEPFARKGSIDEQYGPNGCAAAGSVPFTFNPPANNHRYRIVAVDKSFPGCDGADDPNNTRCQTLISEFVSDTTANYLSTPPQWEGVLLTDRVASTTMISTCSEILCGQIPAPH